jgi:hypothetical protein
MPMNSGNDVSSIHGSHYTSIQSGKGSFHKGSHYEETRTQQSYDEESYHPRLREKYEKMAFLAASGEGQLVAENLGSNTNLPFTDRLMSFSFPDKFKVPRVDRYDGSGDLSDHMEGFRAHLIHSTPDEIACRAFPLTLKGVAKEWFSILSSKFIDKFDTLGCQFLN